MRFSRCGGPHPVNRRRPHRARQQHRLRSIRLLSLSRKNSLFVGSDGGAEHWSMIASLIETAKLNDIDPQAYIASVITRIVAGHPQSDIDQLLPWRYQAKPPAVV